MTTKIDACAFADRWISDWNRKDVEAVLAYFSDDVVFTSPRASAVLGTRRVEGKTRLREYWAKAISRVQTIHFSLDYVISDGDRIAIVYVSEINGKKMRSVEFFAFGADRLVRDGEAMHGIDL